MSGLRKLLVEQISGCCDQPATVDFAIHFQLAGNERENRTIKGVVSAWLDRNVHCELVGIHRRANVANCFEFMLFALRLVHHRHAGDVVHVK